MGAMHATPTLDKKVLKLHHSTYLQLRKKTFLFTFRILDCSYNIPNNTSF